MRAAHERHAASASAPSSGSSTCCRSMSCRGSWARSRKAGSVSCAPGSFARSFRTTRSICRKPRSPDPADYTSFNDFFTRRLRAGARSLDPDARAALCPADGTVSQAGRDRRRHAAAGQGHRLLGHCAPRRRRGTRLRVRRRRLRDDLPRAAQLPPRAHAARRHAAHRALHPGRPLQRQCLDRGERARPLRPQRTHRLRLRHGRGRAGRRAGRRPLRGQHEPCLGGPHRAARTAGSRATCPCSDPIVALDRGAELGWFNMGSTVVVLFAPTRARARRRASRRDARCASANGWRWRDERFRLAAVGEPRRAARARCDARADPRLFRRAGSRGSADARALGRGRQRSGHRVGRGGAGARRAPLPADLAGISDEAAARRGLWRLLPGLPGVPRRRDPAACTIPNSR